MSSVSKAQTLESDLHNFHLVPVHLKRHFLPLASVCGTAVYRPTHCVKWLIRNVYWSWEGRWLKSPYTQLYIYFLLSFYFVETFERCMCSFCFGPGYIEAAVIPAGARRIRVMEDKPAHSFLGKGEPETRDDLTLPFNPTAIFWSFKAAGWLQCRLPSPASHGLGTSTGTPHRPLHPAAASAVTRNNHGWL